MDGGKGVKLIIVHIEEIALILGIACNSPSFY